MNNRIGILITGAAAVVVLILLATLVAWGLRANGSASNVDGLDRETGSPFAPRVYDEARTGYVIAELYQDVGMDVRSRAYDQDGALLDRHWSHDAATQTCSLDLVLADQHGRDEIAPTVTPEPTATAGPVVVLPAIYDSALSPLPTSGIPIPVLPDRTVVLMPTSTPDPPPTATPEPTPVITAATSWNHWKGRPVAIESDGVAVLDLPMDAEVSAWLSVRTGPDSGHNSQTELARMPLPAPHWEMGSAYVALSHASGRILLDSDAVDATYRGRRPAPGHLAPPRLRRSCACAGTVGGGGGQRPPISPSRTGPAAPRRAHAAAGGDRALLGRGARRSVRPCRDAGRSR